MHGLVVVEAARLCAAAKPGQILASALVEALAAGGAASLRAGRRAHAEGAARARRCARDRLGDARGAAIPLSPRLAELARGARSSAAPRSARGSTPRSEAARRGERRARADRGRAGDRQDAARGRARARRARRGRGRARRTLRRGPRRAVPALDAGARAPRRARARGRAARELLGGRRSARCLSSPSCAAASPISPARRSRRRRGGALAAVRGDRRAPRRRLARRPLVVAARRPALGRRAVARAAAPSGALAAARGAARCSAPIARPTSRARIRSPRRSPTCGASRTSSACCCAGSIPPSSARWSRRAPQHEAPEGVRARLHAETEGNPFFAEEVLRHLVEAGALRREERALDGGPAARRARHPEGVREVIGRRLSRALGDRERGAARRVGDRARVRAARARGRRGPRARRAARRDRRGGRARIVVEVPGARGPLRIRARADPPDALRGARQRAAHAPALARRRGARAPPCARPRRARRRDRAPLREGVLAGDPLRAADASLRAGSARRGARGPRGRATRTSSALSRSSIRPARRARATHGAWTGVGHALFHLGERRASARLPRGVPDRRAQRLERADGPLRART